MPKLTLSLRTGFAAAAFSLLSTIPTLAGDITVTESYARAAGASAMAGAAFMEIMNAGPEDDRLISATYKLLGLQTFYTAGEKEIRAWTIKAGLDAPKAAGVIHTDFEKKFIRAEIYSIADLVEHGSEAAIRAAGKLRTEGRSYAMQEGDICHFLIGR